MKDFGEYIRLDNWKEAEDLGLKQGFEGYSTDYPNKALKKANFNEKIHKSTSESSPFFAIYNEEACGYAYVLKSSLPIKQGNAYGIADNKAENDEDFVPKDDNGDSQ